MHYYQFNIGDYSSHTSRLSPIEDLSYRRLLDLYYLNERPFNGCSTDVARDIGLVEYQQEVDYILTKFFPKEGDLWTNKRAEVEIIAYKNKQKQQSEAGKKSAEARRIKGSTLNSNGRSTGVQRDSNGRSTKHKPITNNQKPITKHIKRPESFKNFYSAYPENKKGGRDETAWKKAKSLNLCDDDFQLMIANLETRRRLTPQWYKTFAPGICRYLDEHLWLPTVMPEENNGVQSSTRQTTLAEDLSDRSWCQ